MAIEVQQLNPHELEIQSTDASNYPYIKMRGMLYWNGAAWTKWDKTIDVTLDIEQATTPTIYNIDMAVVDTEYSQALPAGTKKFTFQCRQGNDMRFSFTTGKVATPTAPWTTLKAGMVYFEDSLNLTSKTLYVATDVAGDDVELICWT